MKKTIKILKKSLLVLLAVSMFALSACSSAKAECLTSGMEKSANPIEGFQTDETFIRHYTAFAAELFKNGVTLGENSLLSPLSVIVALAMTANGADGDTLLGMLKTLAGGMTETDLNAYLCYFLNNLPNGEKCRVVPANSIWIREGFPVEEKFLRTDVDYYGADVFRAPFDNGTVRDINAWVKKNTDGMIDSIIDGIDPLTMMYLINALTFEAEWAHKYETADVYDAEFHAQSGETRTVRMMSSSEYGYIDGGNAVGFVKPYHGYEYSFAAIMPKEGVDLNDYIASLTGETLYNLLDNVKDERVIAGLPKFKYEYSISLKDALKAMGMETAFDEENADFSRMSSKKLHIGDVLHKTFIEVAEKGTRAGAVTAIPMNGEGAFADPHEVILDRPFIYMIFDNATNLPIFIGTVTDIG